MNTEHSIESSVTPDEDFRYDIVRSRHRRRTIAITIERDGRVVVRAPAKTGRDTLRQFVQEKRPWIRKKLLQIRQEGTDAHPRAFTSGEKFFYLGGSYPLKVTDSLRGAPPLAFIGEEFQLNERFKGNRKDLFVAWYKIQAEALIRQRIDRYALAAGGVPSERMSALLSERGNPARRVSARPTPSRRSPETATSRRRYRD